MKRSCLFRPLVFIGLSLDEVVDLRVEGVGEVLLAGVLTLQTHRTSSDEDSKIFLTNFISVFHIYISFKKREVIYDENK